MNVSALYTGMAVPESCWVEERIFKKMFLEHGELTSADRKALSEAVDRFTWKFALKASNVQVPPYADSEREYLEIAVIEAELSERRRADRIAQLVQRAIPYPLLLVLVESDEFSLSVAHKRFSKAEAGRIVATDSLRTPWSDVETAELDQALSTALAFKNLSHTDFLAMYGNMVRAVLARNCAALSGRFELNDTDESARRDRLMVCFDLDRQIHTAKTKLHEANSFAEKAELNEHIYLLKQRLTQAKATL